MAKQVTVVIRQNNIPVILKGFEDQVMRGLKAIGETAVGHAKSECPVDTGRLRNSISYATSQEYGGGTDAPNATPAKHDVYIGSNVEYAAVQEYKNMNHKVGKAHFLKDAATTHNDQYAEIMKASLQA